MEKLVSARGWSASSLLYGSSSNLVVGAAGTFITMTPLSASQFIKTDASKNLISQNKIDLSAQLDGIALSDLILAPTRIYVKAVLKLMEQIPVVELLRCTIVHASSSGGTQAGLEVGRQLLGLPGPRIVGVAVAKSAGDLRAEIHELMTQTAQLLGVDRALSPPYVVDGFIGSGYAIPTPGGRAAMSLLARSEGILTDPVYTAKALDALVKLASAHELGQGPVVFWHTGGLPALFADDQGLMRWDEWPS